MGQLGAPELVVAQLGAKERAMLKTLQHALLNILRDPQSAPNSEFGMQTVTRRL